MTSRKLGAGTGAHGDPFPAVPVHRTSGTLSVRFTRPTNGSAERAGQHRVRGAMTFIRVPTRLRMGIPGFTEARRPGHTRFGQGVGFIRILVCPGRLASVNSPGIARGPRQKAGPGVWTFSAIPDAFRGFILRHVLTYS